MPADAAEIVRLAESKFIPGLAELAMDIINDMHPRHAVEFGFLPPEQCVGDDGQAAQGFTLFPDDGTAPQVWINDETPVFGVPEVMMHEMAHVVAGFDADHGPEWQAVYDALCREMGLRLRARATQHDHEAG